MPPLTQKIGFIGLGKMAQAILNGLLSSQITSKSTLFFYEKDTLLSDKLATEIGITALPTIQSVIDTADILFLCVKPQNLQDVASEITQFPTYKIIVSILAGTSTDTLKKAFTPTDTSSQNTAPIIVRVMPNTPAQLQKGITAIATDPSIPLTAITLVQTLLTPIGTTLLTTEAHLDIITAISGSGPAFLYQIAATIAHAGTTHGLSTQDALTLIAHTMIGAGHMILDSGKSPDTLIKDVSSKGGTTVAGLTKYQALDIDTHLTQVIEATYQRAIELKNQS